MHRTVIVALLGFSLAAGSLQAQEPTPSLLRAARAAAARQTASTTTRTPMPPGLMWTGIGLIAYGGPMLVSSILTEAEECPGRSFTIKCEGDLKRLGIATGAAMAGTGGLLLMIGNAKRKPVPSVGFSVDRVTWHVRF